MHLCSVDEGSSEKTRVRGRLVLNVQRWQTNSLSVSLATSHCQIQLNTGQQCSFNRIRLVAREESFNVVREWIKKVGTGWRWQIEASRNRFWLSFDSCCKRKIRHGFDQVQGGSASSILVFN